LKRIVAEKRQKPVDRVTQRLGMKLQSSKANVPPESEANALEHLVVDEFVLFVFTPRFVVRIVEGYVEGGRCCA